MRAEPEDVGSAVEMERVGGVPGVVARDALGPEPLGERVAVEAEPVGPDGDRPREVAGGGEQRRLRAEGALELGDQRVGPGEPGGPVLGRRARFGQLGAGPGVDVLPGKMGEVAEQRGEQRGRGLRARVMGEATPPERDAEESLRGESAVVCVPAGMRAQQDRELAGGVRAMQDGPERLDHLAPHLVKLGPVEVGQPIPRGALERLQRGRLRPSGVSGKSRRVSMHNA